MPTAELTKDKLSEAASLARADAAEFIKTRVRPVRVDLDDRQRELVKTLRRDGFAVVEDFWPRERALEVRDRLERYLEDGESTELDGGAYLHFQDNQAYDEGVQRIYHVDRAEPDLSDFRFDRFSLEIASAYYGIPFYSGMLIFQHNTRSNANTRYHHVDSYWKQFKTFLYLDDVDVGNGPFTYIRGSHRNHLRRLYRQAQGGREGAPTSFNQDDVAYAADREVQITGKAGTMILADVRGFHRGSPQLERSRSVLVNYIYRENRDIPTPVA